MSAAEHFVVVDDEEDLLQALVSALRRSRPAAEVRAFADPVQAAAHLEAASRVDALVTDIRMPKIDGIDLLIRARRRRHRLPAVIMTAFSSPAVVSQVASFGTVEYLDKPFSVSTFLAAIDRVVTPSAGFAGALAIEGLPDGGGDGAVEIGARDPRRVDEVALPWWAIFTTAARPPPAAAGSASPPHPGPPRKRRSRPR